MPEESKQQAKLRPEMTMTTVSSRAATKSVKDVLYYVVLYVYCSYHYLPCLDLPPLFFCVPNWILTSDF